MIVNVPTKVIPVWYVEKWINKNVHPNSAIATWIEQMLKDWEQEEQNECNKH